MPSEADLRQCRTMANKRPNSDMLFSQEEIFTNERPKDVESVESCSSLGSEVDNPMKEFVMNTDEQT